MFRCPAYNHERFLGTVIGIQNTQVWYRKATTLVYDMRIRKIVAANDEVELPVDSDVMS